MSPVQAGEIAESVGRGNDSNPRAPEPVQSPAGEAAGRRGKAITRGPLSVPLSWSTAAPRIQTASLLSAAASRNATARSTAAIPMASTFVKGLMTMLAGPGPITAATRSRDYHKSHGENAEIQHAETRVRDDGSPEAAGTAIDSASMSAPIPGGESPQSTDAHAQGALARAVALAAANTAERTAGPVIAIRILQGQTVSLRYGSTIALAEGTVMLVNSGSITVQGAGTCIANVPVTVNDGSTVTTLGRCYAGGAVIPSDTRLHAGSYGPFTLTQYRRAKVEVELFSGSATTGASPHVGEVITPTHRTATATVGAEGATITITEGSITVTTRRYPQLGHCHGGSSPARMRP
ncbi:hypothetical protein [Mycolicibacterium vulneris]|nr:hypothetical protein [Mycolicibacterium vulneris]